MSKKSVEKGEESVGVAEFGMSEVPVVAEATGFEGALRDDASVLSGEKFEEVTVEERRGWQKLAEATRARAVGVQKWLDEAGRGQEDASGSYDEGAGFYDYQDVGGEADEFADISKSVHGFAERLQRLMAARTTAKHRVGRFPQPATRRDLSMREALAYSVDNQIVVTSLEDAGGVYDRLRAGERVVANLVAPTGFGKTTKFPAVLARKTGLRVLQLEPDARLARQAARAQESSGLVTRAWKKVRCSSLTTMSYADFLGSMRGEDGLRMLKSFDVVYLDEAHVVEPEVDAAKEVLATYAPPSLSILTATASTPEGGVQELGTGSRTVVHTALSLDELLEKGALVRGQYAVDRTLVLVESDKRVAEVQNRLRELRVRVKALDGASTSGDVEQVHEFLESSDAVVKRFLVATRDFGIGHNFRVSQVVTSGMKEVLVVEDGGRVVRTRTERIDRMELLQHCGRVSRGLALGSRAIVCGLMEDFPSVSELSAEQELTKYVILVSCFLHPDAHLVSRVAGTFPRGLSQEVAALLLDLRLPVSIGVRFLAVDGRVPDKWLEGLRRFADDGCYIPISAHSEPVGRELWFPQELGGFYGEEATSGVSDLVPVAADGDWKVVVHSLVLMARGSFTFDKWFAPRSDASGSEDESESVDSRRYRYTPRSVASGPQAKPAPRRLAAYAFEHDPVAARRGATESFSYPVRSALAMLDYDTSLESFEARCAVEKVVDPSGTERVRIPLQESSSAEVTVSPVEVRSPGGTPVCELRSSVWVRLARGEGVTGRLAVSFFGAVRKDVEGFVGSDAFSAWSLVWDGVLATLAANANTVVESGLAGFAVALVQALVGRYTTGVVAVSRNSNVRVEYFDRLLRSRDSYDTVVRRYARRGDLNLAQSEAFMRRLYELRVKLVETLEAMEAAKVFVPFVVTDLQAVIPVFGRTGRQLYDEPGASRKFFRPTRKNPTYW